MLGLMLLPIAILYLIAMLGFFFVVVFHPCYVCLSIKTRMVIRSEIGAEENIGGTLQVNPFYIHREYHVCDSCGHVRLDRTWMGRYEDGPLGEPQHVATDRIG